MTDQSRKVAAQLRTWRVTTYLDLFISRYRLGPVQLMAPIHSRFPPTWSLAMVQEYVAVDPIEGIPRPDH